MVLTDKKNIALGNFKNKVIYYNTDSNSFTFTYLNKNEKISKKIATSSVIAYLLLKLLNDILVFNNLTLKIIILIMCYIFSVSIAKMLFEIDNPRQEKKDYYENKEVIGELLINWRNKTAIAMVMIVVNIFLIILTIYNFFVDGSVFSLFFFFATIIFFEILNTGIFKRFKLLNKLIKEKNIRKL